MAITDKGELAVKKISNMTLVGAILSIVGTLAAMISLFMVSQALNGIEEYNTPVVWGIFCGGLLLLVIGYFIMSAAVKLLELNNRD